MKHIREIKLPSNSRYTVEGQMQQIRERLQELGPVADQEIFDNYGDLHEVADCREKCKSCTGFTTCWRDGEGRGLITELQVSEKDQIHFHYGIECETSMDHHYREKRARLLTDTGISPIERQYSFANFPEAQRRKHTKIVDRALEFVDRKSKGGLYLWGTPGIAKTHLMLAVLNELNKRGTHAVFVRADALIDQLREAVKTGTEEATLERYKTAPVLGIDEFAQERFKFYGLESMIKILDSRATNNLDTWFTSNFRPDKAYQGNYEEHAEKIDALRSRVAMLSIPAKMVGDDWRLMSYDNQLLPDEEL